MDHQRIFPADSAVLCIRRASARVAGALASSLMVLAFVGRADAQRVGTILVAHGGGEAWNRGVLEVAAAATGTGGPVEVAFLMGPAAREYRFQDVAGRLEAAGVSEIVVVPLLVSSHSGHYEQIRFLAGQTDSLSEGMRHHLHMAGIEPARVRVPLHVARAIDDADQLAAVLADRARALGDDPGSQALLLVGHGPNSPEDLAAWMANLRRVATVVKERTGFQDVRVGLVQDDAPAPVRAEAVSRARDLIELQAAATRRPVVVVPILVARGALGDERIPADLHGLPIKYSGEPLLPHEGIARWIESRVLETAAARRIRR